MKNILKIIVVWILTLEAKLVLKKYKPKIIAVTGSVGKTTTKDAIFAALEPTQFVRKNQKSFNSEIGVPLTILGCDTGWSNPIIWLKNILEGLALIVFKNHYPKILVLEVGADKPGDIKNTAQWLKPDIAVITVIPDTPVHVKYFDSPEAVAKEKRSLADALKDDGKLILNGDEARVMKLKEDLRGITTTYGFLPNNDFIASYDELLYEDGAPIGINFRVDHLGSSIPVTMRGSIGKQHIYTALAATAVASLLGADVASISTALSDHVGPPGRMRLINGIKGVTIIDDTYNSSPKAVDEALNTLNRIECKGKKIAVLGDMRELGHFSKAEHKKVGEYVAKVADVLVTVGVRARIIAKAALENGLSPKNVYQYENNEAQRAGKELESSLGEGDIVLAKGSQGSGDDKIRLERLVKEIMAEPLKAPELLVRQDKAWEKY